MRVMVVGAGPVGCAVSLFLARQGMTVTLLDSGQSRHKVCGEGILPAGWSVLKELGLDRHLTVRAPIRGLRYNLAGPDDFRSMTASFRREAYGVERAQLVESFHSALADSKVEYLPATKFRDFQVGPTGVEVTYDSDSDQHRTSVTHLIGADGLHSSVRRKAGLQSKQAVSYRRWGARCYFRSSQNWSEVEVTLGQGMESYLTPLAPGLYGLAFLWSPELLGRPLPGEGPVFQRLLEFLPSGFRKKLPPLSEFWGGETAIGPLQQRVVSVLHPSNRVSLVGDASGYFDALTGEGLCLGLRQAKSLANCLSQERVADYAREHGSIKRRHNLVVGGLLWLLHRPGLRERVFGALAASPKQFQSVIRFAVEEANWSVLLSPQLPQFLWRLLFP